MKNKMKNDLEPYLQELVKNTRSSQLKLIAAWDALSTETQIKLLSQKEKISFYWSGRARWGKDNFFEDYLDIPEEVISKALISENPYVRYLATVGCRNRYFGEKGYERVVNDESLLARSRYILWEDDLSSNPEKFFRLPEDEQYLYFSWRTFSDAEEVSKIINYGINNKLLERDNLYRLIKEYIPNLKKKECHDDGSCWYSETQNELILWRLALPIYEHFDKKAEKTKYYYGVYNIARELVMGLPSPDDGSEDAIANEILQYFPEDLLNDLLRRPDIHFRDFRKRVLFSPEKKYEGHVKYAALSHNFSVDKNDLGGIKKLPLTYRRALEDNEHYQWLMKEKKNNSPDFWDKVGKFFMWGVGIVVLAFVISRYDMTPTWWVSASEILGVFFFGTIFWLRSAIDKKIDSAIERIVEKKPYREHI